MNKSQINNWMIVPLGKLAEFRNGINYTKDNFGTGIKVINVKDFQDYSIASYDNLDEINPDGIIREESLLKEGDIIFVRSNGNRELIGRSLFVGEILEKVTHSAFSIKARFTSDGVFPRFYAYVFRSSLIRQALSAQGNGTNISNLNQGILTNLPVPLPPLPTQRRIAAILSAYDDLIENNARRIAILEEMARNLYREWFVEFRFPGHESVEMVDGVPEGWKIIPLENVCSRITDGSHWSPKTTDTGYPMASVKDMHNWGLDLDGCRRICEEDYHKLVRNDCRPLRNDILIAKDGSYLKHIFVIDSEQEVVVLSSIAILRPNEKFLPNLLSLHLKQPEVVDRMKGYVSGVAIPRIVLKDFRKFLVSVPPRALQEQLNGLIEPMVRECFILTTKNANLRRTRDLLLPKLISGELDVSELEITGVETLTP